MVIIEIKKLLLKAKLKKEGFEVPDVSYGALKYYKYSVPDNVNLDFFTLWKKLIRNWNCAKQGYHDDIKDKRFYYNLTLSLYKTTNTIYRVVNHKMYGASLENRAYDKEKRDKLNELLDL